MERFDRVVLWHIASFLDPIDVARLRGTCRRLYALLPEVTVTEDLWEGKKFHIYGSRGGHWCPEWYFDGPILAGNLLKLEMSVVWQDQGWGNRKGELFAYLMRPSRTGEPVKIAEYRRSEITEEGGIQLVQNVPSRVVFPLEALPTPAEVTCFLWNPRILSPPLERNEALVSSVMELACESLSGADLRNHDGDAKEDFD
ncbi:hypothetical protein AWC38_SpisGene4553 [Stylophora pistillata]|uniref:F-box domain-containing protein n=1 Tax=Stylophora pistillata TaxID=50429 RepID=A0A2B4SQ32_STYPI|nr:hypothetical protein AWC38_SpisGene4553 [Stylophora pistillata]